MELTEPSYRWKKHSGRPSAKTKERILAAVKDWLVRYLDLLELLSATPTTTLPPRPQRTVKRPEDIEAAAEELREEWLLADHPLGSAIEILEEKGIMVGAIELPDSFDAMNTSANKKTPVVVVNTGMPGDRQRFSIAHELAHLYLKPPKNMNACKIADRFAGAFLVPRIAALRELGEKRQSLNVHELHLLKHKYGLSMQGWVHRAEDLSIVSKKTAQTLRAQFREQGWERREPGDQYPPEVPERFARLLMRALEEEIITRSRAEELIRKPLKGFFAEFRKRHHDFPAEVRG